jgi:nitrogen fixation protein FixH
MKALIAAVTAVGLGSVALTIWIGSRVREPTVVPNPYEAGLRYDETRKAATAAAGRGLDEAARAVEDAPRVELDVAPKPPRSMAELTFTARVMRGDAPVEDAEVALELTMPGMYMGENRVALAPRGGGVYEGKGTVVRCPSGRRQWQADVTARPKDGQPPVTGRFPFEVQDP